MLLTCPSPTHRRLMANRSPPGGVPAWSIAGAMHGLNSAADAKAYSRVKYAPIKRFLSAGNADGIITRRAASS